MTNAPTLQHPCCFGISLQSGTKLIAAIQIGLITLIYLIITIVILAAEDEETGNAGLVIWIIVTLFTGVELGFEVLLFMGANQKSAKKLKIFLIYYAIGLGLATLGFLYQLFTWGGVVVSLLSLLIRLYLGWVVYCFYKEVENDPSVTSEQLQC